MSNRIDSPGWISAFRGFYSPRADVKKLDVVSRWLFSARSVILIISMQAAMIAGILAYSAKMFNVLYFALLFSGFVIAHTTSNLTNDYFDFAKGHDTKDSPRLRYTIHPLASHITTKRQLAAAILVLVFSGLLIAGYFTLVHGYLVLAFLLIGALFLLSYDALPITLKSIGLGEIASFVVWGPFMVGSGYYIITGSLALSPFLIGIPYGLGVMSILVGKHIDQIKFDKGIGQHTLPVILGERRARWLNIAIIAFMYASSAILVFYDIASVFLLLVFLNVFALVPTLRILSREKPVGPPNGYVGWPLWYHRTSLRHNRMFGWLYILGLAIGAVATAFL